MGMSVLAGSAVMSLTLIWPSVIAFGSYDLAHDNANATVIYHNFQKKNHHF
ncbi:hypothetical protein Hanom_Chr04g00354151 [Helianthus anomalus]